MRRPRLWPLGRAPVKVPVLSKLSSLKGYYGSPHIQGGFRAFAGIVHSVILAHNEVYAAAG